MVEITHDGSLERGENLLQISGFKVEVNRRKKRCITTTGLEQIKLLLNVFQYARTILPDRQHRNAGLGPEASL
jgi:hypothetical protein